MEESKQSESKPVELSAKRKRSPEEREMIVRASLKQGMTVSGVARLYGVHPSQIYEWRKQARQAAQQAQSATLIPVQVAEPVAVTETSSTQSCCVVIEAQSMRITLTGALDSAVVRTVMECLAR